MIKLKTKKYPIFISDNKLNSLNSLIKNVYNNKEIFIITDQNVYDLYNEEISSVFKNYKLIFYVLKPGETSKSFTEYKKTINFLIEKGIKKDHLIIGLGGGVVGDLAGFVAGTLLRGIDFIQIPTTLLAMVDSSIGSKTGIDLELGKNLVGVFKDPLLIFIDTHFLNTLTEIEYSNGLAEAIKMALIRDKTLFYKIKNNPILSIDDIVKTIKIKLKIVNKDPYEKGIRRLLNFGHTYGHAIEKAHNYEMKHGVAISYGMLISLSEGINKGITNPLIYDEIKEVLLKYNLVKEPLLKKEDYQKYIKLDKKHLSDGLKFVYITDIGNGIIKNEVINHD